MGVSLQRTLSIARGIIEHAGLPRMAPVSKIPAARVASETSINCRALPRTIIDSNSCALPAGRVTPSRECSYTPELADSSFAPMEA